MRKHKNSFSAALLAASCLLTFSFTGCGLLPEEEAEHKIQIVNESIENRYDLAMCEVRDVVLTDTISCQYKQLAQEDLSFSVSGKKVAYLYVREGDEVKAGDVLVKLDIAGYEKGVIDLRELMVKNELTIKQSDEMIEFYEKRIASDSISLLEKEEYLKKLVEVRKQRTEAENETEYAATLIDEYLAEIQNGILVAGIDGTVSYINEDIAAGGYTMANIRAITLMDSSVCGFTAQDKAACEYMEKGGHYTVSTQAGGSYETTLTSIDVENGGKLVFELDEPDYTLSVGTRGTIGITLGIAEQVPSIPRVSVYNADDFNYVYIINENGVREMRKVTIGMTGDNYVEVTGGINLYDSVIVR